MVTAPDYAVLQAWYADLQAEYDTLKVENHALRLEIRGLYGEVTAQLTETISLAEDLLRANEATLHDMKWSDIGGAGGVEGQGRRVEQSRNQLQRYQRELSSRRRPGQFHG